MLSLCEALNLPTGRVKGSALFHHSLSELCRSRPSACWLVMPDSFNWEALSRHAVGADVNRECAWLDLTQEPKHKVILTHQVPALTQVRTVDCGREGEQEPLQVQRKGREGRKARCRSFTDAQRRKGK